MNSDNRNLFYELYSRSRFYDKTKLAHLVSNINMNDSFKLRDYIMSVYKSKHYINWLHKVVVFNYC